MRTRQKITFMFLMVAATVSAGTYTWKGSAERYNDWNWCDPRNFEGGSVPSGTDAVVIIPGGEQVRLLANDEQSRTKVNALGLINTRGTISNKAVLSVEVADDDTFTLETPVHCESDDVGSIDATGGKIVKTGGGTLILGSTGVTDYQLSVEVVSGVVKMCPSAQGSTNYFFCDLIVSNGASLYIAPNMAYTRFISLYGTGTVTNDSSSQLVQTGGTPTNPNVIEAFISRSVIFRPAGYVRMASANNENSACQVNGGDGCYPSVKGVVETPSFGHMNTPSYCGSLSWLQTVENGGFYRYIGDQDETTDSRFSVGRPRAAPSGIDAGPHGGVTFNGTWEVSINSSFAGNCNFYLTGSNVVPCIVACEMSPNNNVSTFSFTKTGTGTWRFNDHSARNNRGGIWVDEGTIQFESAAEAGTVCSLGLSTLLFERGYYGTIADGPRVDYAISLGSPGNVGTLEYVGTNTVRQLTRSVALAGDGRLVNSSQDNGGESRRYFAWFPGVTSIGNGLQHLILDGANANGGDEIANISDGPEGKVGIVKRGSGTWRVSGTNTFSGPIEVEQGKLVLVTPHYTWFKVTMKGVKALDYPSYSTTKETSLHELAFFDKDGYRQNIGLTRVEDQYAFSYSGNPATKFRDVILPGECTYAETVFFNTAASGWYYGRDVRDIDKLFDNSTDVQWAFQRYLPGSQGSTYLNSYPLPIMFRLPEGAKPVTSYDIVTHRSGSSNVGEYVKNPKCWTVEGSVNGREWTLLHTMEDSGADGQSLTIRGAGRWMGHDAAFSSADGVTVPYTYGQTISVAPGGSVGASFGAVEYVSVASNATLVAEGEITLNALKVSAYGAGTLVGFKYAAAGSFIVEDAPNQQVVVLPGTYDQALNGWTVTSSDKNIARRRLVVDANGVARLLKRGTIFILH